MTSCPRSGKSCPYIGFLSDHRDGPYIGFLGDHRDGLAGYHVCNHPKIKKLFQGKNKEYASIHTRGVWSIALPVDEIDNALRGHSL